jgi:predicted Zn-dependent protease
LAAAAATTTGRILGAVSYSAAGPHSRHRDSTGYFPHAEFAADAGAAELTGNPQALARALQRLEANAQRRPMAGSPAFEPLMIVNAVPKQMLSGLFATHPSTEQRVQRLLAMPASQVSLA